MKAYELLYLVKKIAQTKTEVTMTVGYDLDDGYYADITKMPHCVIEALQMNDYLLHLEDGSIRVAHCSALVKNKVMHQIEKLDKGAEEEG